jgi:hypothetical protein
MHQDQGMRTTINLEDDVYQSVKTLAEASSKSLGEIISELIRKGLEPEKCIIEDGLPLFSIPSGAEIIPGNRAQELLSEEGIE